MREGSEAPASSREHRCRGIAAELAPSVIAHTSTSNVEAANLSVLGERRTIVLLYVPLLTMFTTLGMTLVDYDTNHVARSERTYLVSCAVNSDYRHLDRNGAVYTQNCLTPSARLSVCYCI